MRISTKGRYALRLMLELALCYGKGCVSIKDVSTRQGISGKYLEQIISQLGRAGFVRSIRGAQGGYMLTREPEYYTVGMILRQMEGSLAPVPCLDSGDDLCSRADCCVTLEVWTRLHEAINGVVDSITLADLVKRYREKNEE